MRQGLPVLWVVLWFAAPSPAGAATLYHLDQRYGTVAFSVGILSLFDAQGRFPRFAGDLLLDLERPERSQIDVTIDTGAVEMPTQDQTDLLRSAAYLDIAHHPSARFASSAIQPLSPTHYLIHGTLQLRGVTQPQELDATVQDRHFDEARGVEVADFVVGGEIRRSAFGMVADRPMLSDSVRLDIRIRLEVDPTR
ncbi:MAG TPA: YceI family protein [Roseomonas sp.]|nr:YceI family protein [Roseomonas sp.]